MNKTAKELQIKAGELLQTLSEQGFSSLEIVLICAEMRELNTLNTSLHSVMDIFTQGDREKSNKIIEQAIKEAMKKRGKNEI